MISIRDLRVRYGDFEALHGLNLEIEKGELFCLLGPNGAGKTTTIKVLVGLLRPTSGTAQVEGLDVVDQALDVKRLLGYVPDTPYLHEKLSAWESLRLIAGLHGLPEERFVERAEELLGVFDLTERADMLAEDFSHGMRQRLSFACAFMHSPRTVIIDEPWVGLDPRSVREVVDFLKEQTRHGTTVLMSTHSLPIAERIADRVAIVNAGQVVACDRVDALLRDGKEELEELFLSLTEDESAEPEPEPA
ncbi:MAG: ABC transporter ATP-binding protein [Acidobacteriota bacterium]